MATETILTPPEVDNAADGEETKYNLRQVPGVPRIFPDPGTRRFSKMFANRAMMDGSMDAYPSEDQSPWDDGWDIYSEECWARWTR